MDAEWEYQIRITLDERKSLLARQDPTDPTLAPLGHILSRHNASLICQYDAFAGYCASAEIEGVDQYPLYKWTKDTIEDPIKKNKFLKSFTFYIDDMQVYEKAKAEQLEKELQPLLKNGLIDALFKHDTNPANNPHPPKKHNK